NENDILARTLSTGRYEPRAVLPTDSPSMDIQISSNFERLLFEASGRDPDFVNFAMDSLARTGKFEIPEGLLAEIKARFSAYRATREEAASAMSALFAETGYMVDPHTAVGLVAAKKALGEERESRSMVVLSTAHPAKFPDAVRRATGRAPELPDR